MPHTEGDAPKQVNWRTGKELPVVTLSRAQRTEMAPSQSLRAKSPDFQQKERVLGLELAAQNRKPLAILNRKVLCMVALSFLRYRHRYLASSIMSIAIVNRKICCYVGALRFSSEGGESWMDRQIDWQVAHPCTLLTYLIN